MLNEVCALVTGVQTCALPIWMEPFMLVGSGFDAAIHFEHPAWAGMHLHHLLEEVLVPVCSPALLAEAGATPSLDELPRLHRRQNPDAWQLYAQEAGLKLRSEERSVGKGWIRPGRTTGE